jgi:hypothetical protein
VPAEILSRRARPLRATCCASKYLLQLPPFFTGKQKLVDTAGRVERFNKKYANISRRCRQEVTSIFALTVQADRSTTGPFSFYPLFSLPRLRVE